MPAKLEFRDGFTDRTVWDEEDNETVVQAPSIFAEDGAFMFSAEEWDDPDNAMVGWTWNVSIKDAGDIWREVGHTDEPIPLDEAKQALRAWATSLRKTQEPGRFPCAKCRGSGNNAFFYDIKEGPKCTLCKGRGYHETKQAGVV